jgi:phospholipid/cholesterol/gamma-HCH transport system permease protein
MAARTAPAQRRSGPVRRGLAETGELVEFAAAGLRGIPAVVRFPSEAFRQAAILVRGSSLFLVVMSLFTAFSLSTVGYFFLRAGGASDLLGAFMGIAGPRGGAPIMFGYVFASKVGCGMTAELGSMRIADEIDALESEGVDPMRYVVASRIVGAMLFIPIAAGLCLFASNVGAYLDGVVVLQALPGSTFLYDLWHAQSIEDQLFTFIEMSALGMGVVLVSCYFGYRASGGPAGVGVAVARSLVVNLVLVHLIATFFVTLFYGPDPRLPFGG